MSCAYVSSSSIKTETKRISGNGKQSAGARRPRRWGERRSDELGILQVVPKYALAHGPERDRRRLDILQATHGERISFIRQTSGDSEEKGEGGVHRSEEEGRGGAA